MLIQWEPIEEKGNHQISSKKIEQNDEKDDEVVLWT